MFVTTATIGERRRNVPSLSSASATRNSPCPRRAFVPSVRSFPPTTTVGSRPASRSTAATRDVVVVFPCVPATAIPYFIRMSSASISARGMTGIFSSRARTTSGFANVTAEEMTRTSMSSATCAASCGPMWIAAPIVASRRVVSPATRSEPETVYPSVSSTSAMPLMPMPPMPTKWTRRLRPFTAVFPYRGSPDQPPQLLTPPASPATHVPNYRSAARSSSPTPTFAGAAPDHEAETRVRDAVGGVRSSERPGALRHREASRRIAGDLPQRRPEPRAVQIAVEDHGRRPGGHEHLGVPPLVVVRGVGIGDEDRRQADGRHLAARHGARAPDDDVGRRVRGAHVDDERLDAHVEPEGGVAGADGVAVRRPGLVRHLPAAWLLAEGGERLDRRLVQAMRPGAAAEDEDAEPRMRRPRSRGEHARTEGVPGVHRAPLGERADRGREADADPARVPAEEAVRGPGHDVLLEEERRQAPEDRGQHDGDRGVPADADHERGLEAREKDEGAEEPAARGERARGGAGDAPAPHLAAREEVERVGRLGHDARL